MSSSLFLKKRIFFILLFAGIAFVVFIASLKSGPVKQPDRLNIPIVEVAKVELLTIDPLITGFGRAFAHDQWQAISEVSGRVIYRHPELEVGRTLEKGTTLIRIDPVDYELAVAQSVSALKQAQLERERIDLNEQTFQQNMLIAETQLELAKNELNRKADLNKKGLVSSSELEAQRKVVLQQEQQVWEAKQRLELVPSDKDLADANINSARAKLTESERKLSRTEVVMPFTGRVSQVNIARDQLVNPQQLMIEAYDLSLMEVTANVSVQDISTMLQSTSGEARSFNESMPGQNMPDIRNLGLSAQVIYALGDNTFTWLARVDRLSVGINVQANTIGITSQITNNPTNYNPKTNPPLLKDMYVQVDISAPGIENLVVPSSAIHSKRLFVLNEENQLSFVPVRVLYSLDGLSAIKADIKVGERVITSDLLAPVEGMKVQPAGEEKNAELIRREGE